MKTLPPIEARRAEAGKVRVRVDFGQFLPAEIAEVRSTLGASHLVASFALLDGRLASWTSTAVFVLESLGLMLFHHFAQLALAIASISTSL